MPYLTTYNDIDLTFLVDDEMREKLMFDSWLQLVSPTSNNNFNYKSEYATTITINQYDNTGKKIYSIDLIDAYPISMNQLDLDWNNEGVHKLTVTFAYTYWRDNSPISFY
jgi:hypothetical protein